MESVSSVQASLSSVDTPRSPSNNLNTELSRRLTFFEQVCMCPLHAITTKRNPKQPLLLDLFPACSSTAPPASLPFCRRPPPR